MAQKRHVSPDHEHCSCVPALEADVRDLKRRLAEAATHDPLERMKGKAKRTAVDDLSFLDDLPDQDRKYMSKKLGIR
jgi:hypothetical protein